MDALFGFPLGILSTLLGLVLAYWVLVLLGALDIDLLDFGVDTDLDLDLDADAAGVGEGLLGTLGLAGVPLTVSMSLATLFSWLLVALGGNALGETGTLLGTGLLAGGCAGGLALARLAVRPLRRAFSSTTVRDRASLVGRVCTISTGRVDEAFGQAVFEDGGADLLVQVRADPGEGLVRGSRALIISRDQDAGAFRVIAYDDSAERELLD